MRPRVTAGRISVARLLHDAGITPSTLSPAPVSGNTLYPVHSCSLRPKSHCMNTPSTNTGMPQMISAVVVSAVSQNVNCRSAE